MRKDLQIDEFISAFSVLKGWIDKDNALPEWVFGPMPNIMTQMVDDYYNLLVLYMAPETEEEEEMIGWFCWDIGFGINFEEDDPMVEGYDKPVWFIEDFWDFLKWKGVI